MYVVTTLLIEDAKILDVSLFKTKSAAREYVEELVRSTEFELHENDTMQDVDAELAKTGDYEGAYEVVAIWEVDAH